jgi:LppP/LprE lipoprotein
VVIASPSAAGAASHHQNVRHACRIYGPDGGTVRDVWSLPCRAEPLTCLAAVVLVAATLTGCGSGDSTVAKTPQATTTSSATTSSAPSSAASPPSGTAAPPSSSAAPADPCAVNLASPTIAKVVSELPRDPRSSQPWNPEPLAGNYNECAQLSAVVIRANTNADNPTTRAVMFHLGQFIPQGVPDTYGFNGIDTSQCTGDTVALTYPSGIGLSTTVKFRWNGNGVELIGNTPGA